MKLKRLLQKSNLRLTNRLINGYANCTIHNSEGEVAKLFAGGSESESLILSSTAQDKESSTYVQMRKLVNMINEFNAKHGCSYVYAQRRVVEFQDSVVFEFEGEYQQTAMGIYHVKGDVKTKCAEDAYCPDLDFNRTLINFVGGDGQVVTPMFSNKGYTITARKGCKLKITDNVLIDKIDYIFIKEKESSKLLDRGTHLKTKAKLKVRVYRTGSKEGIKHEIKSGSRLNLSYDIEQGVYVPNLVGEHYMIAEKDVVFLTGDLESSAF